jgi:hypothetical protein
MVERSPFPTRVRDSSSGVLDPTRVIPRPQPLDQMAVDGARIISGEIVTGPAHEHSVGNRSRHRAARTRRSSRVAVSTAVLSATGVVAGLSLLTSHESADSSSGKPRDPARTVPDGAAAVDPSLTAASVSAPLRATGEPPQAAEATVPRAVAETAGSSGAKPASGKHARAGGSWDTSDWQEAIERAAAAQRSAQQNQGGGRHRGDGSSGNAGYAPAGGGYGHGYGGHRQGGGQGSVRSRVLDREP